MGYRPEIDRVRTLFWKLEKENRSFQAEFSDRIINKAGRMDWQSVKTTTAQRKGANGWDTSGSATTASWGTA